LHKYESMYTKHTWYEIMSMLQKIIKAECKTRGSSPVQSKCKTVGSSLAGIIKPRNITRACIA
jgi:hypothetical protein